MFSISANTVYAIEDGKHSIEVSYCDSDGINVGAYAEGDNFEKVIFDVVDQIDEAIAEFSDDQADMEESARLEAQIADLQAQINDLIAENEALKARHEEKIAKATNKINKDDFDFDFLKNILKDDNITKPVKWWV